MNTRVTLLCGLLRVAIAVGLVLAVDAGAQTNSWVNPNSGKWEDTNSWSLGILPGMSQSIFIQNTNPITVQIDSATAKNYSSSFSVRSVTVKASNTLAVVDTREEALTCANGLSLMGGTLLISNAVVSAHINGSGGTVMQNGGLAYGGLSFNGGNYFLTNGEFWGDVSISGGAFAQYGDNSSLIANSFGGVLNQNGGGANIDHGFFTGDTVLNSGDLQCGTIEIINQVTQNGGTAAFSDLEVDGGYNFNVAVPPVYTFSGGTLAANDIAVVAKMVIGDSMQAGRVSNPGHLQLAGIIDVGNINEHLGKFILSSATISNVDFNTQSRTTVLSNAFINFVGNNAVLAFANSSAEIWSNGVTLTISNWNGSINGGGNHQLQFGTSASGLTASQIARIRFLNPNGFPSGTYAARILSTGEVVPYAPVLAVKKTSNALVISWADGSYALQAATNVLGPWTNVTAATSPYTNSFTNGPQEFFRLVR